MHIITSLTLAEKQGFIEIMLLLKGKKANMGECHLVGAKRTSRVLVLLSGLFIGMEQRLFYGDCCGDA